MPMTSTLKEFAKAIDTKKTRTTEAFDDVYANRSAFPAADIATLEEPGALDTLPPWLEQALVDRGLNKREINHINKWPPSQKEDMREKLVQAIADNRPIHFFWDLHDGDSEKTKSEPDPDPGAGEIKVTFLSPWKNVKVWGLGYIFEKVTVDVG